MGYKCAITGEYCHVPGGGFEPGSGDLCPIERYKNSDRYYNPGESKRGTKFRIDYVCRYYGLARAAELQAHGNFMQEDKSYIGREY